MPKDIKEILREIEKLDNAIQELVELRQMKCRELMSKLYKGNKDGRE